VNQFTSGAEKLAGGLPLAENVPAFAGERLRRGRPAHLAGFERAGLSRRLTGIVRRGSSVAMKTLIVLIAAVGIGYVGWTLWLRAHRRKHDPVEYFAGWDGYTLPIRLTTLISKQEAEAIAARGNAYLIGYFDDDGRLVRDVKMLKGAVFFEHLYDYYPSGKLRRVSVTNPKGVMTTREYPDGALPGFFW